MSFTRNKFSILIIIIGVHMN